MEIKTQTHELNFNSADYPLGHLVVTCGDDVIVGPDTPSEAQMRWEAVKYIGRQVLPAAGRMSRSVGHAAVVVGRHVIESNK